MSESIGRGFCLVMALQDPARLAELMQKLDSARYKPRIQKALAGLDYVHYARFVPVWEQGLLLIVTEFDGAMPDYVMDFAAVLDDEFSLILSYMKDQPPLPVSRYPEQFWQYVDKHTGPKAPQPGAYPEPFSAYPGLTALEIAGAARSKALPDPLPGEPEPEVVLADVQAHTLRAYKATLAWHCGFEFKSASQGRELLRALAARLTPASANMRGESQCVTLGLTHAGLQALELPQATLEQFPQAFREGPRLRSERLGDVGRSAPVHWRVAGHDAHGHAVVVHGMVSVYTNGDRKALDDGVRRVREALAKGADERFTQEAQAIGTQGEIHFGYRDGIGQPRFQAAEPAHTHSARPIAPPGDLLLGPQFRNARGSYAIGALPGALATHGTYAALRVIQQDVAAFEQFLRGVRDEHGIDPELMAAKLVGRWRNGSPLPQYPTRPHPKGGDVSAELLDAFGYSGRAHLPDEHALAKTGEAPASVIDDREGRRCPFGAHIRRLNPRDGMVLGVPWGRRIVRRGMPYTERDARGEVVERGLVGLFLCADLESQFEFIQHVWANQGLSAPGLRHTQDPFSSANQVATPFRFRPTESEAEVTVMVPPLTTTIGSLYLFMPGLSGVRWLADAGWRSERAGAASTPKLSPRDITMDLSTFDPTTPQFNADPYRYFAAFRRQQPVALIGKPYDTRWVFSRALVDEVCRNDKVFLKPGKNRADDGARPFALAHEFGDGLFFMDPPRHREVREIMDGVFKAAIVKAPESARQGALALLEKAKAAGQIDLVKDYAGPLASHVFFHLMGIGGGTESLVVDLWIRQAMHSHDKGLRDDQRIGGATATLALRTYLQALGREVARGAGPAAAGDVRTIMAGIQASVASPNGMNPDEATNTALHMALGGYLSTEFLIGSGLYNLLRDPSQWQLLRSGRATIEQAVNEMLRFDAPFQMADRYVEDDTPLGDFKLEGRKMFTIVYGSANRDLPDSDEPDRFDITRDAKQNHYGFGAGIHHCIGAPLGRIVTGVAVSALLEACPGARLGAVSPWGADPYFRTLSSLQVLLR